MTEIETELSHHPEIGPRLFRMHADADFTNGRNPALNCRAEQLDMTWNWTMPKVARFLCTVFRSPG